MTAAMHKLGEKQLVLLKWMTVAAVPISGFTFLAILTLPLSRMPPPPTHDILLMIGSIIVPLWVGWRAKCSLSGLLASAGIWIVVLSCLSLAKFLTEFFSSI